MSLSKEIAGCDGSGELQDVLQDMYSKRGRVLARFQRGKGCLPSR